MLSLEQLQRTFRIIRAEVPIHPAAPVSVCTLSLLSNQRVQCYGWRDLVRVPLTNCGYLELIGIIVLARAFVLQDLHENFALISQDLVLNIKLVMHDLFLRWRIGVQLEVLTVNHIFGRQAHQVRPVCRSVFTSACRL